MPNNEFTVNREGLDAAFGGLVGNANGTVSYRSGTRYVRTPYGIPDNFDWGIGESRTQKTPSKKSVSPTKSSDLKLIAGERTFGVEFEAILPYNNGGKLTSFKKRLPDGVKYQNDQSIHPPKPNHRAIEVVTPILKGSAGVRYINNILNVMQGDEAYTNESCGLHLHIGMDDVIDPFGLRGERVSVMRSLTSALEYTKKFFNEFASSPSVQPIVLLIPSKMRSAVLDTIYRYANEAISYHHLYQVLFEHLQKERTKSPFSLALVESLRTSGWNIPVYMVMHQEVRSELASDFEVAFVQDPHRINEIIKWINNVYATFDPVFRGMFVEIRRDNNYSYPPKFLKDNMVVDGANIFGIPRPETKYCGLNLLALEKFGTVEIRYHEGTISKEAVIHWNTLHQNIISAVVNAVNTGNMEYLIDWCLEADYVVSPMAKLQVLLSRLPELPKNIGQYYSMLLEKAPEEDLKVLSRLSSWKSSGSQDSQHWSHRKSRRPRKL